jgi:hypothetical protein
MEARLSEILAARGEPVERPQVAATPSPREMRPVVTDAPSSSGPASATSSPPAKPKEPAVRKSLFDRLLGR